jgi:hypothetical protein
MSIAKPPLRTLVCSACVVLALASSLIQGRGGVGGWLGLTDDLDNGGVAAWNYIGLAGGHPSKNYRYKPDADFGNNSLAHSGERLDGGFRNTAMPSGAARATKTYALGAHGDLDAGQVPDIGPSDAPAGAWAGPDHPYGYLANNPFSGVEYLGLWNTSSWVQNWFFNPVWNLRNPASGWFSQGGPAGQFYEATTHLPVLNLVRASVESVTLEDAFSGARLTRGVANLRLAGAAIDTALVLAPAMGAMRSVAALRAGAAWSIEAEALASFRNASRTLASEARFLGQGFGQAQARYLAQPYERMGHHFLRREWGLPQGITNSRFSLLKPSGISRGNFYELHYRVDPTFYGAAFPKSIGGSWSGNTIGLKKLGFFGRMWYGSPGPLKIGVAGAAAAGGGAYWYLNNDK